jgi:hypothetical protein
MKDDPLVFMKAGGTATVADRQILQLAFATLIADWAVERVVDQQELHHALLGLDCQLRMRKHPHAVGHRCCAGRQRLRRFLDLHQAHATVGGDRKLLVITEMRNIGTKLLRGIHDGTAVRHMGHLAVDFDFHRLVP